MILLIKSSPITREISRLGLSNRFGYRAARFQRPLEDLLYNNLPIYPRRSSLRGEDSLILGSDRMIDSGLNDE